MQPRCSTVIAALLATLVALPFAAPFSTCTLADILGDPPDELSIEQGTVATIGDVTVADDDSPDPGPPHVARLRTWLAVSAAANAPVLPPASAAVTAVTVAHSDLPVPRTERSAVLRV